MNSSGYETVGHVLSWISLIHALIACVISVVLVIIIIFHMHHNRLKHEEKIASILCANIYFVICMYTMILSATNIETLLGDFHNTVSNSWCIFKGYWITVSAYVLYCTFVMQVSLEVCLLWT